MDCMMGFSDMKFFKRVIYWKWIHWKGYYVGWSIPFSRIFFKRIYRYKI